MRNFEDRMIADKENYISNPNINQSKGYRYSKRESFDISEKGGQMQERQKYSLKLYHILKEREEKRERRQQGQQRIFSQEMSQVSDDYDDLDLDEFEFEFNDDKLLKSENAIAQNNLAKTKKSLLYPKVIIIHSEDEPQSFEYPLQELSMLEDNMSSELAAKLTKEKKFFEKKKEKDSQNRYSLRERKKKSKTLPMSENRTLDNRIKKWLKTVENPTIKMIKKKAKQLNPSPYLKIQSWFEKFKSKNKDIFKKTEDQ